MVELWNPCEALIMCHLFYSWVWALLCMPAGSCHVRACKGNPVTFFFFVHPTATLHAKMTDLTKRVEPMSPRAKSLLAGTGSVRRWASATSCPARLDPSVLFGPAVIWERLQRRCFVSLTRVNLPYLFSNEARDGCGCPAHAPSGHVNVWTWCVTDSSYQSAKMDGKHLCCINKCAWRWFWTHAGMPGL